MIGSSILSRFGRFTDPFRVFFPTHKQVRPDLHAAWLQPNRLSHLVNQSPVAQHYLDLLGPLAWDHLPERDLNRNWGQTTIPYSAFIPACLVKLNEGQASMSDLRSFIVEHPELVELFGFPLPVSNPGQTGFDVNASLPTARHFTRMLRQLPNAGLQFLLADSVRLIREALRAEDVPVGDCISLDTKHILACVKENNPKVLVKNRFDASVSARQPWTELLRN